MPPTPRLVPEPFDGAGAQRLIAASVEAGVRSYGEPSSEEPPRAGDFLPPGGFFLVAYNGSDAVGCGGFKHFERDVAELKRMYVAPEFRGRGLGRAILEHLEREAAARGYVAMRLETGVKQPAALALYRSTGYEPIPCWGCFAADPKSVCLGKTL